MKKITGSLTVLVALGLSACGGGGGSNSIGPATLPSLNATPTPPVNAPTNTPTSDPGASATPGATATPNSGNAAAGQVSVSFSVPARDPVSVGSTAAPLNEVIADITSLNGGTTLPGGVSASTKVALNSGQGCSTATPCSFTMPAPTGTVAITVTAYANNLPVATQSTTYSSTGAAGQSQSLNLNGIVSTVNLTQPSFTVGTAATQFITVAAIDPSGAQLLNGAYADPFTLTDGDTSGATTLQIVGATAAPGSVVTVNSPSNQVQINYNGASYAPFSIRANTSTYTYAQSIAK